VACAAHLAPAARSVALPPRPRAEGDPGGGPVLRQRGHIQRDQPEPVASVAAPQDRQRAARRPRGNRHRQSGLPATAPGRARRAAQRRAGQTPGRGARRSDCAVSLASDLRGIVGDSLVVEAPAELRSYAYDASFLTQLAPRAPEAVVIAKSVADVEKV